MLFDVSESNPEDRLGEAVAVGGGCEALDGVGVGAEAAGDGTDANAACCEVFACVVPPGMGPRR